MKTKVFKRSIALILSILMIFVQLPLSTVFAATQNPEDGTICVESVSACSGSSVEVKVNITNNPGILGGALKLTYDEGLTLKEATNGTAFSGLTLTKPGSFASPCKFVWDGIDQAVTSDGTILTLVFDVAKNLGSGKILNVNIDYDEGDFVNDALEIKNPETVSGSIKIFNFTPGDVNNDTLINTTDVILTRRYQSTGYDVSNVIAQACDVDNNCKVNSTDTILLRRYIAGGYGVVLKYSTWSINHEHTMEKVAAKEATCKEEGNIEYWYCQSCGKYYKDEDGNEEITLEDTVVAKTTEHKHIVTDPAVPATSDQDGLTEGSHCEECGQVIVPQYPVKFEDYVITYNISNGDNYIAGQIVENTNPATYKKGESVQLTDVSVPGYRFDGWYDGATSSAKKVTEIPANTDKNLTLYAHWEVITYTAQLNMGLDIGIDHANDIEFTVNKSKLLPTPTYGGYYFMCWLDQNGNVVKEIPTGIAENVIYEAKWTSVRNSTKPVKSLSDPIICENSDDGQILFVYELGTIENVPLYNIAELTCANGVVSVTEISKSHSISSEEAKTEATGLSQTTNESTMWTLAEAWNDITTVDETYAEQHGLTQEEANTIAKSSTNTYELKTSDGGSYVITDAYGNSVKVSASNTESKTKTKEKGQDFKLNANWSYDSGMELEFEGIKAAKDGFNIGLGAEYSNYVKKTNTTTKSSTIAAEVFGENSHSEVDTRTWNTDESYSSSNTVSQEQTYRTAISQLISQEKHVGTSYSIGGSNEKAQSWANAETQDRQYSSSLAYYNSDIETSTTSYTINGKDNWKYRLVCAGKVHVYGVVGYDVANKAYYTYTYNVLDEETKEFIDVSCKSTGFDDEENGVIPFEIPLYVDEYVASKIIKTQGLVVDQNTGIIESYEGTDSVVYVPSYISVDNKDGTMKSVKITGISSTAFAGNTNIEAVSLGDYITDIPDNAFVGCTSLRIISCPFVTSIGNNAFAGCTALDSFSISNNMSSQLDYTREEDGSYSTSQSFVGAFTSLGANAFNGVKKLTVIANTPEIAIAAANSNAKEITIDLSSMQGTLKDTTLTIPDTVDYFELDGNGVVLENVSIESNAKKTVVNGITFNNNQGTPLKTSSAELTLVNDTLNSNGLALIMTSENTKVGLQGTISVSSSIEDAVLCRSTELYRLDSGVVGKMNVSGNVLVWGNITGSKLLNVSKGTIKYITEEEFNNYLSSHTIRFDANYDGGTVDPETKTIRYNDPLGELPVPTRDYYDFTGWYTEAEGGEMVSADTVCNTPGDVILYAHWQQHPVSEDWVLYSELPEGAEVVKTKWTLESTKSSMDGFASEKEPYKGYSEWGAEQGSVTWNPGNSETRRTTRTVYHPAVTHHVWWYWRYINSSGDQMSDRQVGGCNTYQRIDLTWALTATGNNVNGTALYAEYTYNGNSHLRRCWCYGGEYDVTDQAAYTEYWYQDRSIVYTYYYYKEVDGNDNNTPSGNNVQKYVKYRVK